MHGQERHQSKINGQKRDSYVSWQQDARVCVKTTLKPDPVVCAIKSTGKLERVAMKNGSEELW